MRKITLLFLIVSISPLYVHAMIFGGSNFSITGYPSHSCMKPTKPYKPYSFNSQLEIDSYNTEVEFYNSELEQYLSCIDEYIENVNNDIKRIKEKAQEAIDEANY